MAYYHYKTGVIVPFIHKFYKQIIAVFAAILLTTMAAMSLNANAAPGNKNAAATVRKVNICHYDKDEGTFKLINISQNAEAQHLANHGDGHPGDTTVPSMGPGYSLSSTCELIFTRSAEITSPEEGAVLPIGSDVTFAATLIDKDGDDNVQWAVRKGTCVAGTGTVAGNVDGFTDGNGGWDGASFEYIADTSTWEAGGYCFIFNPTESVGDLAIRETREFTLAFEGPVGANVQGYVEPTTECDVNVVNSDNLQDAITNATSGQTVCVGDGTYNEFVVDKPLTIAGMTNPNDGTATIVPSAATVTDLASVSSSDVTITGLKFDGTGVVFTGHQLAGVRISPVPGNDIDNVHVTYNVFKNLSANSATASSKAVQYYSAIATDTITGSTIMHNVIDGITSTNKGAYGVQTNGDTDGLAISYNTISNVDGAWGAGVAIDSTVIVDNTNTVVSRNIIVSGIEVIGGITVSVQVEHKVDQTGITVNENNLLGVVHGSGLAAVDTAVNAENNWWGDADPSNQIWGTVDYNLFATSAFSTW